MRVTIDDMTSRALDDLDLLAVALRSRAGTVASLAALSLIDERDVREGLLELERRGYLTVAGEEIRYADASAALVGDVRHRATELMDRIGGLLGDLVGVVDHVPGLVRAAAIGQAGDQLGEVEVFHGESAVTDLWHHLLGRNPLRRTDVVLPDASHLFVADPEMQATWHQVVSAPGNRARVIGAIADGTHPDAQARVAQELAAGVEVRLMQEPPSWFWVADEAIVAVPLGWGEAWPTTVVAVHSTALAGMASWAFEQLWGQAVAVRREQASWDPLIRLICNGATVEGAARTLGISERTGRRRMADAMSHYRVSNPVALGVAWGREQRLG